MDFKQVAIIGVNPITVSIAMGLKAQKEPPSIVGYDPERVAAKLAQAQGAFDRAERKPGPTCEEAELTIVATPLTGIRETFAAIAPHLRPGCLVTDTARLKTPVLQWAEELLPESVSFVSGRPILHPVIVGDAPLEEMEARADLLKEALYCLTPPPGGAGAGVDALARMIKTLGAHPFFIDATEHDGLQTGVEELPDLLAAALLRATVDTPGWQEMRKFASNRFAAATELAEGAHERRAALFLNRRNAINRLDILLNELTRLRDLLAQGDEKLLEEALTTAAGSRARWLHERKQGLWGTEQTINTENMPTLGDKMAEMFLGGSLSRRLKERPGRSPKE